MRQATKRRDHIMFAFVSEQKSSLSIGQIEICRLLCVGGVIYPSLSYTRAYVHSTPTADHQLKSAERKEERKFNDKIELFNQVNGLCWLNWILTNSFQFSFHFNWINVDVNWEWKFFSILLFHWNIVCCWTQREVFWIPAFVDSATIIWSKQKMRAKKSNYFPSLVNLFESSLISFRKQMRKTIELRTLFWRFDLMFSYLSAKWGFSTWLVVLFEYFYQSDSAVVNWQRPL